MKKNILNTYSKYLNKRNLFKPHIETSPSSKLGISIIIPCFNEPFILETLISIAQCKKPQKKTEVIIVINSAEDTDLNIVQFNRNTKRKIENWAANLNIEWLQVFTILLEKVPKKKAGVGYARKTGMDEAIKRFLYGEIADAVICSLDADSTVSKNYLTEIERTFFERKANGCSIYFEHEIEGTNYSNEIYRRIIEYELHLRYFKLALKEINFPYHHYTIGSCFAVTPIAYCLQGGMNSKQAGEDFYFLQKIMPMGKYYGLNSTTVYPSSRPSDRVPFGTGPTIHNHAIEPLKDFTTYNHSSFKPLNQLFSKRESFFNISNQEINILIKDLPICLNEFIMKSKFIEGIDNINANTKKLENFNRKFFDWFDGFRIIKYLNFAHLHHFKKQNILEACKEIANISEHQEIEAKELLLKFRNMEKV